MARSTRRRGRSMRGRSSVFRPNSSRFNQQYVTAASGVQPPLTPTIPETDVLGPPMQPVLHPTVEDSAPEGGLIGGDTGDSGLVDAIMAEPEEQESADPFFPGGDGGYTPQGPAPIIPDIIDSGPSIPGPAPIIPDIINPPGEEWEEPEPANRLGAGSYNQAKLYRLLMEEGY